LGHSSESKTENTQNQRTERDQSTQASPSSKTSTEALIDWIDRLIQPLGYEVVHLELQSHRQKTLRVFIDFADSRGTTDSGEEKAIGIEDCVAVTRALDEPLDQIPEIEALLHGAYELEVSSPGVDRPLRQAKDFVRFAKREARIHTFRPLTAEEIGNEAYFSKNPKQKNFFGTLLGVSGDKVQLAVSPGPSAEKGKSKRKPKTNKEAETGASAEISIPLPLISKANLEPKFDFGTEEAD
jgi:ribosome maturation factor RimP